MRRLSVHEWQVPSFFDGPVERLCEEAADHSRPEQKKAPVNGFVHVETYSLVVVGIQDADERVLHKPVQIHSLPEVQREMFLVDEIVPDGPLRPFSGIGGGPCAAAVDAVYTH